MTSPRPDSTRAGGGRLADERPTHLDAGYPLGLDAADTPCILPFASPGERFALLVSTVPEIFAPRSFSLDEQPGNKASNKAIADSVHA